METTTEDSPAQETEIKTTETKNRQISVEPDWCAGCGDFGVLSSLQGATTKKVFNMKMVCGNTLYF